MSNFLRKDSKYRFTLPVAVLKTHTPKDVARAMIEEGRQNEPFYTFNMDEIYQRIQYFKKSMPRVKIFYAMKSNDSEMLLKLAISEGLGFDCASPGEIYKLRKLNVDPKNMIYTMPSKTPEQMIYAKETGVKYAVFDSSFELASVKKYWHNVSLLIRIRVESSCKYDLNEKFGCEMDAEAFNLLDEAAQIGLNVVGVAFHVGSICSSTKSYVTALRHARLLFDHEAKAGRSMSIVNIGGGFQSDRTDRIDEPSVLINQTLEELFPDPSIQVIAEPGRYICDSSFTLYCNIINVRKVQRINKSINMIYLNDGIFGTFRFFEKWQIPYKFKWSTERTGEELEECTLWGPTCASVDRVMEDFCIKLPKCKPLDWLVFDNHGAYTITIASNFSSLEKPSVRPVISGELWRSLKDKHIFDASDFELEPDIAAKLPSTLPPLLPMFSKSSSCREILQNVDKSNVL